MDNETPLPANVAPITAPDILSPEQWEVLLSICDTIIPSVEYDDRGPSHGSSPDAGYDDKASLVKAYYHEKASQIPELRGLLTRLFNIVLNSTERAEISRMLTLLSYSAASILLTGRVTVFAKQPLSVRQDILEGWAHSILPPLRLFQRTMTLMTKNLWSRTSPNLRPLIGLPRVPLDGKIGEGFDFNFIQIPPGSEPEVIETDVVIVGSGCGGGVCAKELAEAGFNVIVVEKGHYWPPEYLPMDDIQGPCQLYMNEGQIISDDGSVVALAGSTWGGGGAINWSASWPAQPYVRQQWADTGLPLFTSEEFQESVDQVCATMGVSTDHIKHNKPNLMLLEGCKALGWKHSVIGQNTGGHEHSCGHCHFGCRSAEKQGPGVAWLPKAAEAGARFIEGLMVNNVEFDDVEGQKVAKGVRGVWTSRDEHGGVAGKPTTTREVFIKAKRVIVSCGSLQSPLLLMRSGLTNPQIGRNLYLHPVTLVGGIYEEEIKPWEGSILTTACTEFEDLDGEGHGVKVEVMNTLPNTWLTWSPWENGQQFKKLASQMDHTAGFVIVHRDKVTGRVYPDPEDGRCRIEYSPSPSDRQMILQGIMRTAQLCYETGAHEIFTIVPGFKPFVRTSGTTKAQFDDWARGILSHGLPTPQSYFGSAHQMGTCRMSASSDKGVVGPQGQVWGTKGLYVADASVFPTASGVNPSVTTYAIADYIARSIVTGRKLARR
ncbi:unnamed protein product [Clonostachys chloroleuca]|uniref:Long-chain-alcohol oxidase n=1 Tax=Clonostachys chloroleuca TaxID=1926264 RepID=A0AA35VQQ5_9HYPO|nr:unnamed protein product [Clonostachys chloroleuca]